jgi:hypothetical protein
MDVVVGAVYLAPNLCVQGSNWTTLMELADYLHVQGLPFIVTGDFNCEIGELELACLERFLGAEWVTPTGPVPGGHRAIDLVLASPCSRGILDMSWDPHSTWATPHTGFQVKLLWKALSPPQSSGTLKICSLGVTKRPKGHLKASCGPKITQSSGTF